MAVYTAYYDAGGTQSDFGGALVVAALVATECSWCRFERESSRILKRHGNVPALHMKDLVPGKGVFKGWDNTQKAALLTPLITLMQRRILVTYSVGVFLNDFEAANTRYCLKETYGAGDPESGALGYCAQACVALVTNWMGDNHNRKRIAHVFEKGDTGARSFARFVDSHHLGSARAVSFVEKYDKQTGDRVRAFEAADLMAWEQRNVYNTVSTQHFLPPRKSRERLEAIPHYHTIQPAEYIEGMCRSRPDLIPPRA
jgi:hypothetical protein